MKFMVEDIEVQFPYPRICAPPAPFPKSTHSTTSPSFCCDSTVPADPEQYAYMLELKRSLDAKGHSMLEMPTGTGKTITLLSLITSYQRVHRETMGKLIYCTRTIPEMEKVLEELKTLEAHRDELFGAERPERLLGVGLSSRRNLCVHPRVSMHTEKDKVDQECRNLTASWVRERAKANSSGAGPSLAPEAADADEDAAADDDEEMDGGGGGGGGGGHELCSFYETLESQGTDASLPRGVFTLEELKEHAAGKGFCPYFLARHAIQFADVVVYNYQYLLDPKISTLVSASMQRECVVVFDEAHNIDNICIEVMSINFRNPTLEACNRNLSRMESEVARLKASDASRLNDEYQRLVQVPWRQNCQSIGARNIGARLPISPPALTEIRTSAVGAKFCHPGREQS